MPHPHLLRTILVISLATAALASAEAATIHPDLQQLMTSSRDGTELPVLMVFDRKADLAALDSAALDRADPATRRGLVLDALRRHADEVAAPARAIAAARGVAVTDQIGRAHV